MTKTVGIHLLLKYEQLRNKHLLHLITFRLSVPIVLHCLFTEAQPPPSLQLFKFQNVTSKVHLPVLNLNTSCFNCSTNTILTLNPFSTSYILQ